MKGTQELSSVATPEQLARELEQLELSSYEARVLVALLQLGSGNSLQLAQRSGVPRSSTYQVLEELNNKGLAQRLSVEGPATWASPGRDEIFDRLETAMEERLRQQRARSARARKLVAEMMPEAPAAANPYLHVIQGAAHVSALYERLLGRVEDELLVLNHPPYALDSARINPTVLATVERGVHARVLYQAEQWHDPDAEPFRHAMAVYHDAGVLGRVVDEMPLKLAIIDRSITLLVLTDPVLPDIGFPMTLLIEHPGFARMQAEGFERMWAGARPLRLPTRSADESANAGRAGAA